MILSCWAKDHWLNFVSASQIFFPLFWHQTLINACSGLWNCSSDFTCVVSSHVLSHVGLRFYCLFVCSLIQAAMNYKNSSEAPRKPYQYSTPFRLHLSESFAHFSGSSHYAAPHNLRWQGHALVLALVKREIRQLLMHIHHTDSQIWWVALPVAGKETNKH